MLQTQAVRTDFPKPNNAPKKSMLEKQWPVDNYCRVNVVIRAMKCNVPGGIESLLRIPGITSSSTDIPDDLIFDNDETGNDSSDQQSYEAEQAAASQQQHDKKIKKEVAKFGSALLRAAKGTTDRIERGMAGLAVRADKGNNPDWTCAGVFIADHVTNSWKHLGNTNSIAVSQDGNDSDTIFTIPLEVSGALVTDPRVDNIIQVRLMLRSGARLLNQFGNKNKAGGGGKSYVVGTANFRISQLLSHNITATPANQVQTNNSHKVISAALQSLVPGINGTGTICLSLLQDMKFPLLNSLGYSLSDPNPGYCHAYNKVYHPPLLQMYAHKSEDKFQTNNSGNNPSPLLVGIERTIESTVVLPCASALYKLVLGASHTSSSHASSLLEQVCTNKATISPPPNGTKNGCTHCSIIIGSFWKYSSDASMNGMNMGPCSVSMSLQGASCIFEEDLWSGETSLFSWQPQSHTHQQQPLNPPPVDKKLGGPTVSFYPKLSKIQQGNKIGALRFQISFGNTPVLTDTTLTSSSMYTSSDTTAAELCEGILDMDPFLSSQQQPTSIHIPLWDKERKTQRGVLSVSLTVNCNNVSSDNKDLFNADGGLVSIMGLRSPPDSGIVIDRCMSENNQSTMDDTTRRRLQQLSTLGDFYSPEWMKAHALKRNTHLNTITDRIYKYTSAIGIPQYNTALEGELLTPTEKKEHPAPYRPSSSKAVEILSGIPMNVHVHSIVLNDATQNSETIRPLSVYSNVTCGACADHAAGFKSGGLRRFQLKRNELIDIVKKRKKDLISKVQAYFQSTRSGSRHIPTSNVEISKARQACIEAEQYLADLTWACAVRRANVLSHAIGIGLTSFLSSVSNVCHSTTDVNRINAKAEFWKRHGYLICFEGLLSAAGKELGMIEDTSVAIDMLNGVGVQFFPHNPSEQIDGRSKVAVYGSQYLRWIQFVHQAPNPGQQGTPENTTLVQPSFFLQVGIDVSYYNQKLPVPLRNGAVVRFYSMLFEMGVDIVQWTANTSANARKTVADKRNESFSPNNSVAPAPDQTLSTFDDDDDGDDDMSSQDFDILTTLNMEAFKKMNTFANIIYPQPNQQPPNSGLAIGNESSSVNPLLFNLYENIRSSAGKIQHGVIDCAAQAATQLSGGGVIFCKSKCLYT